jgi:DNA-binding response OmpR family regulator
LIARVKAALRRGTPIENQPSQLRFQYKDLNIDFPRQIVTVNGERVKLTAIEYRVLACLAQRAGVTTLPEKSSKRYGVKNTVKISMP